MTHLIYDPEALGLQVTRINGEEALCFCPYHSDNTASAEYNIAIGVFYCFTCQTAKNTKQLAEDLGGSLVPMGTVLETYKAFRGTDSDWLMLTRNPSAIGNEYLAKRKVGETQILLNGLLQNEDGIIFPIKNRFGAVVGVQIRHFTRKPKYLFYGARQPIWPYSMMGWRGNLFITEGVFGALRGEGHLVATASMMGASAVETTAKFLKAWRDSAGTNPFVVMDRDYAGRLAAGKFVLHGIPAVLTPWKSEPDEWSQPQWTGVRDDPWKYATEDVNLVIDQSPDPVRIERSLKKYYRRMNRNG